MYGNGPEEVKQDLEGMQTMRKLARNMVWLLRCIELGGVLGIRPSRAVENLNSPILLDSVIPTFTDVEQYIELTDEKGLKSTFSL